MLVTIENHEGIVERLNSKTVLALDTETAGLDWFDRLFSIIISDDSEDFYFDRRLLCKNFDWIVDPVILHPHNWIFKNAKFDMRMLFMDGFHITGVIEDIGTAARILKNDHWGKKAYSLAELAKREGMEKLDIAEAYIKKNKLYEVRKTRLNEEYKQPMYNEVPLDVIGEYACKDGRLTYDLREIYLSRMDDDDRRVYENECKLIPVCFDMEMSGIRINIEYTEKGMAYEEEKLKEVRRHFLQATGKEYEDTKSLLIPIFEAAGEIIPSTDKGNPSLTGDVLETFSSPVAKIVQNIRSHEKRISTYYKNYINGYDKGGYIHPTMWPDGTRTGRFSYSNPNLQNIPKEEDPEAPYVIRGCFVPTPGNVFVSFDYKQMEYRMMLAYANARRLIDEVMNGADVHTATSQLLGITRDRAKTLNFAILYGAGIEEISRMLSIPMAEASRLRTKYFLGLPDVERLIWDVIRTGRDRGYVKNWLGRKLRADRDFCYALPNHLIQGGCADVVKVAMNRIHPLLASRKSKMVLQVHDQLLMDMYPQDFDLVPEIKKIMESVWSMNGMDLLVDVEWSRTSFAERDMEAWGG